MERADLEKLGIEGWKALPKGERMFLAERNKATGKGEEIIALCRKHAIPASTAHDLISVHGYGRASDILDRTRGVLAQLEEAGDTTQALPVIADTDASVCGHAPGMTDLMVTPEAIDQALAEVFPTEYSAVYTATGHGKDERCTSYTRVALHEEVDENPEWVDVQCYLNEEHTDDWHCGWHPTLGSLRWRVPTEANEA